MHFYTKHSLSRHATVYTNQPIHRSQSKCSHMQISWWRHAVCLTTPEPQLLFFFSPFFYLRSLPFEFGSGCREHAQCAACCLQSVEQLSRVWNSNMAEAELSLPLSNLDCFQTPSSRTSPPPAAPSRTLSASMALWSPPLPCHLHR